MVISVLSYQVSTAHRMQNDYVLVEVADNESVHVKVRANPMCPYSVDTLLFIDPLGFHFEPPASS